MDHNEFMTRQRSRSHLVILGAGASMAAIPDGDKNGKRLSCMDNFLSELNIEQVIDNCNLKTSSKNLEDIYSELEERAECEEIKNKLETIITERFSKLLLPDYMTVYDYLIISLRKKDLIASFNWDPLLIQAYNRMSKLTKDLPDLVFLHGNIWAGFCINCKSYGHIKNKCQVCEKALSKTRLLYPIKNKNYDKDPFIIEQWIRVKEWIKDSTIVTFFGYSAPKTDAAAIELLKDIYNDGPLHRFDSIEIIDIKEKEELQSTWNNFINIEGAYSPLYLKSFYESILAEFPRRSIEGYSERNFNGWWGKGKNHITPKRQTIEEFYRQISPILTKETNKDFSLS